MSLPSSAPKIDIKGSIREHILDRPDTYLGNFIVDEYETLIVGENGKIATKTFSYNPALERTVIEIGSNCVDNVWRSTEAKKKCTEIRLSISDDGTISFFNDGLTIDVAKHSKVPDKYIPAVAFSVFFTSSNYDDTEKRRSSGRNGYGSKLANTMSKVFTVETQDQTRGLHYTQTWRDNMSIEEPPIVTKKKGKGFTRVTFLPDYARFKMNGVDENMRGLLKKYMYDVAMLTKVPTYFNDELIEIRNIVDYSRMFFAEPSNEFLHISNENYEVVVTPSNDPMIIAFTNGIPNPHGGTHVDLWSKTIFSEITSKLNAGIKPKNPSVTPPKLTLQEVRGKFALFVSCSMDNPAFTSQEKSRLASQCPPTGFTPAHLSKIMRWEIISDLKLLLESKMLRVYKKKLEGPKTAHPKVDKLEEANFAGHSTKGRKCVLIYCEGDSAKTFAVAGIQAGIVSGGENISGRDYFGILPCGGKILNVRNADADKIGNNAGIQALIQTLGLELDLDYTIDKNYNRLRYGKLMIVADADDDGLHIEGLCHNFFHALFPSLMKRNPPFITSMRTPLVRAALRNGEIKKFYRLVDFKEFQDSRGDEIVGHPRYYKGLGTNNDQDVIDAFGQRIVHYVESKDDTEWMVKAFDKNFADTRKEWIMNYDPSRAIPGDLSKVDITRSVVEFIENELIVFSVANCARAIPSIIDGLKNSHRKIMFVCLLKKIFKSMKVAQLGALVAQLSHYAHGEEILNRVISALGQDYTGSNNLALLFPDGQFGSRLANGEDAASPRYLFTRLQDFIPSLFRPEDSQILNYIKSEDGGTIEPYRFYPILPLVLINGIRGSIGTGFSSYIPAFNPRDVIAAVRKWIVDEQTDLCKIGNVTFSNLDEMTPWYRGFKGEIKKIDGKFITHGIVTRTGETTVEITELPIGMATDKFRAQLVELRTNEKIEGFMDYSSKTRVHFIVEENDGFTCSIQSLGLTSSLPMTNMVAFNDDERITHYKSVDHIIYDFCNARLRIYQVRKDFILDDLRKKLVVAKAKHRFVDEIVNDKITIYRKSRSEIIEILVENKYPEYEGKFDYLLKMSIDSLSRDMIEKLRENVKKIENEIETLENTTPREMWLGEIDEFEKHYDAYEKNWEENEKLVNKNNKKLAVAMKPRKTRAKSTK